MYKSAFYLSFPYGSNIIFRSFVELLNNIAMEKKFIINIGRELGSGGKAIGERLAQSYNIHIYDKKLIKLAAEESGLCQGFFEKADENNKGFISSLMGGLRIPFMGDGTIYDNYLSNDALFKIQSDVIRKLAQEESCIFIGRCADYILRDHPRCVNIFITANIEDRIKRIREINAAITEEEAELYLEKADKKRSSYYNYYSNKTWGAAATYHLCINSSVFGLDRTADYIEQFINKKLSIKE